MMQRDLLNEPISKLAYRLRESLDLYQQDIQSKNTLLELLTDFINTAFRYNPWFTAENVVAGLDLFIEELHLLSKTLPEETWDSPGVSKNIGFVYNISRPFECLSEIIFTAFSNFNCKVMTTPDDKMLFRKFIILIENAGLKLSRVAEVDNLKQCDGYVIFKKLNDTSKQYFSKYPILELNAGDIKGSSLIITGKEDEADLIKTADCFCLFFGRSIKNVKLFFIPHEYNLSILENYLQKYNDQLLHHRYFNNYEYRKSVMIINHIPFTEAAPILITDQTDQAGYTSVLALARYNNIKECFSNELQKSFPALNFHGNKISDITLSAFKTNLLLLKQFLNETKSDRK